MSGVAGLVLLVLGRRRLPARGSSEIDESAAGPQSAVDSRGRDRTLPRWLDPSLAAARRPDRSPAVAPDRRLATAPARVPIVFVTPGDELGGLHHVRYDGVPLLDRPDDVLGRPIQELDGGDEVNVLERAEIWARVRTPDNLFGWVPGMTLSAGSAAPAEEPVDPRAAIDLELPAVVAEPIALEALFEAIATQRLALREPSLDAAAAPPRRRTRKPKAEAPPAEAPPTSTRRRPQRLKAKPDQEA